MARQIVLAAALSLIAACDALAPPSPSPPPAPSFAPIADEDCPVPEDIDGGAFRAAICPTIVATVNALRGRDLDGLLAVSTDETINCEQALADDPAIVGEFPQCGAVPPPTITGFTWCPEPVGPTCQVVGRAEFGGHLRGLLESADPAASDDHGSGELRVVGFDLCGGTQVLRTSLIARPTEAGGEPERWIIDIFMRARPLVSEEPVSDTFLIRRVDAAPLDDWTALSADPLSEGRCGEILPWSA